MAPRSVIMGERGVMSNHTTLTSRKGLIPCNDQELYNFLTDMRSYASIIPEGVVSGWQATEDTCSFRVDKIGKINAQILEALPYSFVSCSADTMITGKVSASINIEGISNEQSEVVLTVSARLNPFIKMMIGDAAEKYLNDLITAVENYKGYSKIKKCTQSP